MTDHALVRSWKDPDARIPGVDHPAGEIELGQMTGGAQDFVKATEFVLSLGCCAGFTEACFTMVQVCTFVTTPCTQFRCP